MERAESASRTRRERVEGRDRPTLVLPVGAPQAGPRIGIVVVGRAAISSNVQAYVVPLAVAPKTWSLQVS
ncbi:hypothetical protein [Streptomyces noursei]|uniref:hypothetical protein n=1 Tax=Streptomyces noursei TaxID=1971 RepID=UPI0013520EDA